MVLLPSGYVSKGIIDLWDYGTFLGVWLEIVWNPATSAISRTRMDTKFNNVFGVPRACRLKRP